MKSLPPSLVVTFLAAPIVFPVAHPRVAACEKATAETLKQLERELTNSAAEGGSKGYMAYYAEDSVELPDNYGLIQGEAEIAKTMGFSMTRTIV